MRHEGDRMDASRKEAAKFQILRKAGLVLQGRYDANGDHVNITISPLNGQRREMPVTVQHREFEGEVHTAYIPSNKEIAGLRRAIAMG